VAPFYTDDDDFRQHLTDVGLVCTQWAYLEFLFEITFWWLLGLLNSPKDGRLITGSLNLETLSKRVCELSHLRVQEQEDRKLFESLRDRIGQITEERNLAVHGVRSLLPDTTVTATVARGRYKNIPQSISLIRSASLNKELGAIIEALQPLLIRLGVLEDTDALSITMAQGYLPATGSETPSA
jgi:hypothetical protein